MRKAGNENATIHSNSRIKIHGMQLLSFQFLPPPGTGHVPPTAKVALKSLARGIRPLRRFLADTTESHPRISNAARRRGIFRFDCTSDGMHAPGSSSPRRYCRQCATSDRWMTRPFLKGETYLLWRVPASDKPQEPAFGTPVSVDHMVGELAWTLLKKKKNFIA